MERCAVSHCLSGRSRRPSIGALGSRNRRDYEEPEQNECCGGCESHPEGCISTARVTVRVSRCRVACPCVMPESFHVAGSFGRAARRDTTAHTPTAWRRKTSAAPARPRPSCRSTTTVPRRPTSPGAASGTGRCARSTLTEGTGAAARQYCPAIMTRAGAGAGWSGPEAGSPSTSTTPASRCCRARSSLMPAASIRSRTVGTSCSSIVISRVRIRSRYSFAARRMILATPAPAGARTQRGAVEPWCASTERRSKVDPDLPPCDSGDVMGCSVRSLTPRVISRRAAESSPRSRGCTRNGSARGRTTLVVGARALVAPSG